eukprot:scaffold1400_cov113-Isochrysis_galbana.AAC.8
MSHGGVKPLPNAGREVGRASGGGAKNLWVRCEWEAATAKGVWRTHVGALRRRLHRFEHG